MGMETCPFFSIRRKYMQKIYIVEDDKNIAEIEEFALKNSGFEVFKCQGFR